MPVTINLTPQIPWKMPGEFTGKSRTVIAAWRSQHAGFNNGGGLIPVWAIKPQAQLVWQVLGPEFVSKHPAFGVGSAWIAWYDEFTPGAMPAYMNHACYAARSVANNSVWVTDEHAYAMFVAQWHKRIKLEANTPEGLDT